MMRRLAPLFGLMGCATLPPPTYVHSVPTVTGSEGREIGVDAALGPMTGGSVGWSAPVPGAEVLVGDVRATGNVGSIGLTPGLWLRTLPQPDGGILFGTRLGLSGGLGDAFGAGDPLAGRWVGPALHLQVGVGNEAFRGAVTLGTEWMFPLANPIGVNDGDDVVMLDGVWFDLDTRFDIALGDEKAPLLGLGVGVNAWAGALFLPQATLGLRFR